MVRQKRALALALALVPGHGVLWQAQRFPPFGWYSRNLG